MSERFLVAGMGNELLGDDGFGMEVARRFAREAPAGVRVVEAGIAGIGLVQDLMDPYRAVVIIDAVERGSLPGTLHLLEIEVPSIDRIGEAERRELLADMHSTVPSRALFLARALGVLPQSAYILGCQPESHEVGIGLSSPVAAAVGEAIGILHALINRLAAANSAAPAAIGA